jgi:adenine phosphoribosyltransferase
MDLAFVKQSVRNIPDYPKPGINFKDVTSAYGDPAVFHFVSTSIADKYSNLGITKVLGIESRGFILGGSLADRLGAGFVPIRKSGKLPAAVFSQSFDLEYGSDTLEIHQDALSSDDVVLIHDDILATGGTMAAAISLVRRFGVSKIYVNAFIELDFLAGKELLDPAIPVWSLIHF